MKKTLKFSFLLALALSCFGCDQVTKSAARSLLSESAPVSFLNGFIKFQYVENPGAFLSLGAELSAELRFLLFVVFTGLVLILMPLLVIKKRNIKLPQLIGLALLAGGAIGNLTDRILNSGQVVDFVSLGIGSLRTGIFNAADLAVMSGAALLVTGLMMHKEGSSNPPGSGNMPEAAG